MLDIFKEVTGEGEDVVLFHGWAAIDHRHMEPVAKLLSSKYRVTNFDLPGAGQSAWDASIDSIEDFARQLLPYLPEKAIYIGWSFGGLVSMAIAKLYPERVTRIVTICSTPCFVEDEGWPGAPKPGFQAGFSQVQTLGLVPFLKPLYEAEFKGPESSKQGLVDLLAMLEGAADKVNLDILMKGITICDKTDLRDAVAQIQCPIDFIFGAEDGATIHLDSHALIENLNELVNTHVLKKAAHFPHWTHPVLFNQKLLEIIA